MPTWYGDLLRYRHGGAMLVSDSDSDIVGPSNKGYLRTTTDGSGQVSNREGLLSCLTSADRRWWVEMEYWRVSSLVPGYMTVSWTVSPPAVGVRANCEVWRKASGRRGALKVHVNWDSPIPLHQLTKEGLAVVLIHTVPSIC